MKHYGAVETAKDIVTKEYVDDVNALLAAKIDVLWDALFTEITTNPFEIAFDTLEGISGVVGIWREDLQRLEC